MYKTNPLKEEGVARTTAIFIVAIVVVGVVVGVGTWLATRPSPKPSELELKNLSISPVEAGETATVSVDVTNTGEVESTWNVALKINGSTEDTKPVTLVGGESDTITFSVKKDIGSYDVEINGLTGTLKVNPKFKIAVVSDVGGRGDLAFNDMAFKGGEEAEEEFSVEMIELISSKEADYLPNLREAAENPDVELIVGVGYLLSDSLFTVAQEYPDKNFAGIDTYTQSIAKGALGEPLPNMLDIAFEEHKGSALGGALGALLAAEYDKSHIGGVFGIEIPVLWKFETGYKWGAKWALENWLPANKPEEAFDYTKDFVLYDYTGTFSDVAKGYESAKPMYDKGAVAVYNIAGPLGLGINRAVKEIVPEDQKMGPPFWIGVDANQDWINPGFVIASVMKRVDMGVEYSTELVSKGEFRYAVREYDGAITLGIGTTVLGRPMEGISLSNLDVLSEFIQMGLAAEELTGEKVLPMETEKIKARVEEMREAQPDWVWDGVEELKEKIRSGKPIADLDGDGTPEGVPRTDESDEIEYWRDVLG